MQPVLLARQIERLTRRYRPSLSEVCWNVVGKVPASPEVDRPLLTVIARLLRYRTHARCLNLRLGGLAADVTPDVLVTWWLRMEPWIQAEILQVLIDTVAYVLRRRKTLVRRDFALITLLTGGLHWAWPYRHLIARARHGGGELRQLAAATDGEERARVLLGQAEHEDYPNLAWYQECPPRQQESGDDDTACLFCSVEEGRFWNARVRQALARELAEFIDGFGRRRTVPAGVDAIELRAPSRRAYDLASRLAPWGRRDLGHLVQELYYLVQWGPACGLTTGFASLLGRYLRYRTHLRGLNLPYPLKDRGGNQASDVTAWLLAHFWPVLEEPLRMRIVELLIATVADVLRRRATLVRPDFALVTLLTGSLEWARPLADAIRAARHGGAELRELVATVPEPRRAAVLLGQLDPGEYPELAWSQTAGPWSDDVRAMDEMPFTRERLRLPSAGGQAIVAQLQWLV